MKQQKNKPITLDEFDNISLWQMLPCGDGLALKKLRSIVNSILNGQVERETNKPLSLLITGEVGKRTHAYAFLRALGIEDIKHICANMLETHRDVMEFFCNSSPDTGYIISNMQFLPATVQKKIYQIIEEGEHRSVDLYKMEVVSTPVFGTIVCTSKNEKAVTGCINDSFEYHCKLRAYTIQQKELIALQRLKYANIEIEDEGVLQILMLYSLSNLYDLIKLLNLSIVVMLGEGRNVLTRDDVKKGKELW